MIEIGAPVPCPRVSALRENLPPSLPVSWKQGVSFLQCWARPCSPPPLPWPLFAVWLGSDLGTTGRGADCHKKSCPVSLAQRFEGLSSEFQTEGPQRAAAWLVMAQVPRP